LSYAAVKVGRMTNPQKFEAIKGLTVAHFPAFVGDAPYQVITRERQEQAENDGLPNPLAPGATRANGAGNRKRYEEPHPYRTPFVRDRERVIHSKPWRRLAYKCQVYIHPDNDHIRTRITHAIEVWGIAESLARTMGLNVPLAGAAGLAHDCGHGPAGHASEEAFAPYMPNGEYDHAVYGADVVLEPLNLCVETLDGVRNHSWRRPDPLTPEGEVVAWADRIAYVCHDFEDAVAAGVVSENDLPRDVKDVVGVRRSKQIDTFVNAMIETCAAEGIVGMREPEAHALNEFRKFNFERIYERPAAQHQRVRVIALLRGLVDYYIGVPTVMGGLEVEPNSQHAQAEAVRYVSGMSDRMALDAAVAHLGWSQENLPRGVVLDVADDPVLFTVGM
jgi:dGTPase